MSDRALNGALEHVRRFVAGQRPTAPSDADLLGRFARQRDDDAFAELVGRHGAMVFGVCRRVLRDSHDADDAFQATFLLLARKAGVLRKQASVGSWLYKVAFRSASNLRRGRERRRARERAVELPAPAGPSDDASWREVRAILDEELDQLPRHLRAPLVLCYLEGKTRDEAAAELGWSPTTFRGRLERGREALRRRLDARGFGLPAALLATLVAEGASGSLPTALASTAVIGATAVAAGRALEGVVSGQAAQLFHGALRSMFLTRITHSALALAAAVLVVGAGSLGWRSLAQDAPDQPAAKQPPTGSGAVPGPLARNPASEAPANLERFSLRIALFEPPTRLKVRIPSLQLYVTPPPDGPVAVYATDQSPASVRIRPEEALRLTAVLEKDGYFREAQPGKTGKRTQVWLEVNVGSTDGPRLRAADRMQYGLSLPYEGRTVRRLEALRDCLEGEARKRMNDFLAQLEPDRDRNTDLVQAYPQGPGVPDATPALPAGVLKVELRGKLLREGLKYRMAVRSPEAIDQMVEDMSGWGPMMLELVRSEDKDRPLDDHLKALEGREVVLTGFLRVRPNAQDGPVLSVLVKDAAQVRAVGPPAVKQRVRNDDALEANLAWHRAVGKDQVRISWFIDGNSKVAMICEADLAKATAYSARQVHNWATQASEHHTLSSTQVASIRKLIAKLPASADENADPRWMVMVSVQEGGQGKTSFYPRGKLIPEIRRLLDLTGAPFNEDRLEVK